MQKLLPSHLSSIFVFNSDCHLYLTRQKDNLHLHAHKYSFALGYRVLKFGMTFLSHFVIHLLFLVKNINNFKYQPKLITCRNFANYDPVAFCNDLRSSDFGSVFTSSCVNDACSRFKCILQQSIDKHAPLITKKIKGRLCPWMTSEVKSEMNLRDQLLRKARRTNREIDWSSYKRQRNKVNSQVKKCKM